MEKGNYVDQTCPAAGSRVLHITSLGLALPQGPVKLHWHHQVSGPTSYLCQLISHHLNPPFPP